MQDSRASSHLSVTVGQPRLEYWRRWNKTRRANDQAHTAGSGSLFPSMTSLSAAVNLSMSISTRSSTHFVPYMGIRYPLVACTAAVPIVHPYQT